MKTLSLELRKLGLKEKEAKIYLAGLELGPSSVLSISKKAGVTRPTTYELIKNLAQKGLYEESKEGKKRYFTAQSPEKILGILRLQKRELEEKEREFIRIISTLEASSAKDGQDPKVYRGDEGRKILEEKLSFTAEPNILVFTDSTDHIKEREELYQSIKRRTGDLKVKEVYCSSGQVPDSSLSYVKRKVTSCDEIFEGTIIIADSVFLFPSNRDSALIESEMVRSAFTALFSSLWLK